MTGKDDERPIPRFSKLRFLVESYYDVQALRIQSENRLRSYSKAQEEQLRNQLQVLSDWVDQRMSKCEHELKAMVLKECRTIPIAKEYLLKIKGVGPCIAGGIIAYMESPERFNTISALWAYSGYHVVDGHAPRRTKGQKSNWNPHLRRICWLASESFVKVTRSPYRVLYDESKEFYRKKFPKEIETGRKSREGKMIVNYTKGHIHAMAKRRVVKIFLANVWSHWREMEGLPVEPPYIIGREGHSHQIDIAV
jgi:Transposase IS116/IS110/IS902 family